MAGKILRFVMGAVVVASVAVMPPRISVGDDSPTTKAADMTGVKGTALFSGKTSVWSAQLKANGDGTYTASYTATWSGKPAMTYEGTIKTDWKGDISGSGKSTGGGGNGSFEFAGKFDEKGVANCSYKEVGGKRSGTLIVDNSKK